MKKEQILNTTLALIAKKGISGSPMSLIAKESGIAIGTIYHHYKSKDEIINALYLKKKEDFQTLLSEFLPSDLTIEQKFTGIWKSFYFYFVNNPLNFRFSQQIGSSPIITPETKAEGQTYYAAIFDFYQEGIDRGIFVDMDTIIMGQLQFSNIMSMVELAIEGADITEEKLQEAMAYSWRAILK